MSCLDFCFWGVRRSRPSTLTELNAVVETFAESVNPEERSARSSWNHARVCREVAGASFEDSLNKILKGLEH